jgi:hypothetical protein
MSARRWPRSSARAALVWGLACALAALAAGAAAVDRWQPELYDEEFATRMAILQQRRVEDPDRPLLAVIGSSRTALAFAPEQLPPLVTPAGKRVLPFNCSHFGAGPAMNLMLLRRLLDAGVRPRWVVVELMPQFLAHESWQYLTHSAAARDLPRLGRYYGAAELACGYARRRLQLLPQLSRCVLDEVPTPTGTGALESPGFGPLGGHTALLEDIGPADRARLTATAANGIRGFAISPAADGATRDLLELCRAKSVGVVLLLSPEAAVYRNCYPPTADTNLRAFGAALARDYGVAFVDGRDWLADDDFFDGHHVLKRGAAAFTRRLHREVLEPLVRGEFPVRRTVPHIEPRCTRP